MAFMTSSKRYVDNARIPSNFTYRMSLVRPQMHTVRTAAKMASARQGQARSAKSLTHQFLGVRFSEAYRDSDGGRFSGRPSLAMSNYGTIDSADECRNGSVCAGGAAAAAAGRTAEGGRRRSNLTRLTPNGNTLLGGELSLMRRRETMLDEEESEDNSSAAGERRRSAQETALLTGELARIRALLTFVVDSQRAFRAKLDREQMREKIEREWGRVFMKFDYVCLTVFQLLNMFSLLFFLKFAWSESPKQPERPLV
uniref:Neur_chan_memb domain-containing protein n=1 Tax=Globodera pallida TaxID=36090 RepID=A0A183CQY6_GLOPA